VQTNQGSRNCTPTMAPEQRVASIGWPIIVWALLRRGVPRGASSGPRRRCPCPFGRSRVRHVRFFVNGEQTFDLALPLRESDELCIVQALSGG
jgi:hypothetical protein